MKIHYFTAIFTVTDAELTEAGLTADDLQAPDLRDVFGPENLVAGPNTAPNRAVAVSVFEGGWETAT